MLQTAPQPQRAEVPAENEMTVAKDSRYARYLKMVQVVSPNTHLILDCKAKFDKLGISLWFLSILGSSCHGDTE